MVQKVTKVHQEKIMNMMKVNETHVQVVHKKIEILYYFRFAARRVNIFSINLNFTYTRAMSQFGIHFILATNVCNVTTEDFGDSASHILLKKFF